MNRRKLVYFLSAFVIIVGCYVLNLSYSLFTQNILTEDNVVESTIPILNAKLETSVFTIPANSEQIVTLKIINLGSTEIQFGISIPVLPEGVSSFLIEKEGNVIVGNLESNTTKEILVSVKNDNSESVDITFNLESKYETIFFDKETFINSSNIDCVNKVEILIEEN